MRSLNLVPVLAGIFVLLGFIQLITGDYLAAGVWFALGIALAASPLAARRESVARVSPAGRLARLVVALAATAGAMAMFALLVVRDFTG